MSWVSGLVSCTSETVWSDGIPPWNWIPTQDPLHYLMAERPRWDDQDPPNPLPLAILSDPAVVAAGGYQIGAWDIHTGEAHGPVDAAAYEVVRPLGNSPTQVIRDPETGDPIDSIPAGLATLNLRYQQFAGSSQSRLGEETLYPPDNQPFPGIMGRMYWPEISHPNKHGWQFELDWQFDEARRDPAQVFIGVFSDADCTQYLYQVGAMYLGTSAFQFDENGDPRTVWLQNNFGTQNTEEPTEIHFAICNGHITFHEGRATLSLGEEIEQDLYWKDNQPSPEPAVQFLADVYRAGPQVSVASNDPLTGQQKVAIRQAMRDAGVPNKEIAQCGALQGKVTAKEAFLGLLACIYNGIITYPPSP